MSLNQPALFGGGIRFKDVTSSLSDGSSSLKVVSYSFFSPVSASAISKPIFEIKSTEDKTKIYTPIFLDQEKMLHPLVIWIQAPHQKAEVVGSLLIIAQS